jgi:hypothetical protein
MLQMLPSNAILIIQTTTILKIMATTSIKMQKKNLDSSPDETRAFEKGKIDVANLGDVTIGRAIFGPGWSWEKCVKPIAKTSSCQAPHTMMLSQEE